MNIEKIDSMYWARTFSLVIAISLLCGCWQIQSLSNKLYKVNPSNTGSEISSARSGTQENSQAQTTLSDWYYESLGQCAVNSDPLSSFTLPEKTDLWGRIRAGFKLTNTRNRQTLEQLAWLNRHPDYLERVGKRGHAFLHFIVSEVERRGLPSEFALLPIVESAFDPFAYSHGRAAGIWQIIPSTGRSLGLKQNWWYDGRRDIMASTHAALDYLEKMHSRFDGDWLLAMAAYNSGAGNVNKAIRHNKKKGRPLDYWSLNLPKETKAYVPRLLAIKQLVLSPDTHNIKLHPIPDQAFFTSVNTSSQIDLAFAAELAELTIEEIYQLNPGFNRWATDPDGPHQLLLPIKKAAAFEEKLNNSPKKQRVSWLRYTVKKGDTLSTIAQKMRTTVEQIQIANNLHNSNIRLGKTLLVPSASKGLKSYALSAKQRQKNIQSRGKGQRISHVVKEGDSFWTIGRRHKVSTRQLAKWNAMAPGDTLKIGQKLTIWKKTKQAKNSQIRRLAYNVRTGDSLARIANKFNVRLQDIIDWNSVNPKKYLRPGQRLTLYVDVTQTSH